MKKEKRVIQVIIKSGLITWVLLLLIWQTGSLFYSDDFLPGPVTTFAGAGKLVASGELFRDILISMQRVLKGWLLGGNRLSTHQDFIIRQTGSLSVFLHSVSLVF